MNKEAFYYYYVYGALQIYLLIYLGRSDVYHNKK